MNSNVFYDEDIKFFQPISLMFYVGVIILFAVYIILIFYDIMDIREGDSSARLLEAATINLDLDYFIKGMWRKVWPPLPFICHKVIINLLLKIGVSSYWIIQSILIFSGFLAVSSLVLFYWFMRESYGVFCAILTVLIVLSLPLFHGVATSVLGQIFALPLILLGLLFIKKEYSDCWKWVLFGVFLLLATMCRTEAILIAISVSIILIRERRFKLFVIINIISSLFVAIQQIILIKSSSFSYLDTSKVYNYASLNFNDKFSWFIYQLQQASQLFDSVKFNLFFSILITTALFGLLYMWRHRRLNPLILALFSSPFLLIGYNFIFLGKMHAVDYLIGYIFFSGVVAIGIGSIFQVIKNKNIRKPLLFIFLLLLFILSARAVIAAIEWRKPPKSVIAVRKWINANKAEYDAICYDDFFSHYLVGRTAKLDNLSLLWAYSNRYQMRKSLVLKKPTNRYEEFAHNALNFIVRKNARYVVSFTPERWHQIKEKRNSFAKHKLKPSYILPFMKEKKVSNQKIWVLDKPDLIPFKIMLFPVYSYGNLMVYETKVLKQ